MCNCKGTCSLCCRYDAFYKREEETVETNSSTTNQLLRIRELYKQVIRTGIASHELACAIETLDNELSTMSMAYLPVQWHPKR